MARKILFKIIIFVLGLSVSFLLSGCRRSSKENEQKILMEEIKKATIEVSNAADNSEAQMQQAKTNYMETQEIIAKALAAKSLKDKRPLIDEIQASAKMAEESADFARTSAEIALSKAGVAEKAYSSLTEDFGTLSDHSQVTEEIREVINEANKDALRADKFQVKANEYAHLAKKSEQNLENAITAVSEMAKADEITVEMENLVENAKQNVIQAQNSLEKLETAYKTGNMNEANRAYNKILELSGNTEKIIIDGEQDIKLIDDCLGNIDKKLNPINERHTEDNKSLLVEALDKMLDKTQKTGYLAESLNIELDQEFELMKEIRGNARELTGENFQVNRKSMPENPDRKYNSNISDVDLAEIPSMPVPPRIVSLPKGFFELEKIEEESSINEHVPTLNGNWEQVSGSTDADFLPGSYLTNKLTFKSRDVLEIRRSFGKEDAIVITWRLKYQLDKKNYELVIRSDGNQKLLKKSQSGLKGLGVEIEAARQSMPAILQYELLKDGRIIINDKIYKPIK